METQVRVTATATTTWGFDSPDRDKGLVVERCGPHVLVRHRDEEPWGRSVLTGYRVPPAVIVVLAGRQRSRRRQFGVPSDEHGGRRGGVASDSSASRSTAAA